MEDEIVALHQRLRAFFTLIFGNQGGYIAFATIDRTKEQSDKEYFQQSFYHFPDRLDEAFIEVITSKGQTHDIYFCAQLATKPKRTKENIRLVSSIWADLDTCPPEVLLLQPTITIETSPGRHHAFWRMDDPIPAEQGEEFARRIAYHHANDGCDNGWGLTKLLRVPYTFNHKPEYEAKYEERPFIRPVDAFSAVNTFYLPEDFDAYPTTEALAISRPTSATPPSSIPTGAQILYTNYAGRIDDFTLTLFEREPNDDLAGMLGFERADWSELLHSLQMQLFEKPGLTPQEVFAVCKDAACNKFRRDKWRRDPDQDLWQDVQRAYAKHHKNQARERPAAKADVAPAEASPESDALTSETPGGSDVLLSAEESARAARDFTFIDKYKEQLSNITDAPPDFHVASAFMLLSYLCARCVLLKLNFEPRGVHPGLWFMVLAPPATRKSTAYNHAREFLKNVDPGHSQISLTSPEGFFQELSEYSYEGLPVVYAVDEVQDNLFGQQRKDFMSGFLGILSNVYDGKRIRKILKRGNFDIQNPKVIAYCTGILQTTLERMGETEAFSSGLAQRFLYVIQDKPTEPEKRRRMAPAGDDHHGSVHGVEQELHAIHERYSSGTYDVLFDPMVADRMGDTEDTLVNEAQRIGTAYAQQEWISTYDRLAKHIVRAAVLIACSRPQNPVNGSVVVSEDDFLKALWFGELWRRSARIVLEAVGRPPYERLVDKTVRVVADHGKYGCTRDKVYRELSLTAKDGAELIETLAQRGIVNIDFVKKAKKRSEWMPEFRAQPDPKDRITLVGELQ